MKDGHKATQEQKNYQPIFYFPFSHPADFKITEKLLGPDQIVTKFQFLLLMGFSSAAPCSNTNALRLNCIKVTIFEADISYVEKESPNQLSELQIIMSNSNIITLKQNKKS